MEDKRMEISSICMELKKLADSGVLDQNTRGACTQAMTLLTQLRTIAISELADPLAMEKLRFMLVRQGEG
jgi:hypothetical protein